MLLSSLTKVSQRVLDDVDKFALDIFESLRVRNLTNIVDVVFVSDHGMTNTHDAELIYMDDILGDVFRMVEHIDGKHVFHEVNIHVYRSSRQGWPSMGLRFPSQTNSTYYLNVLLGAAAKSSGKFNVYTLDTMPTRYHFSNQIHHKRIPPIYVVPNLGYHLTDRLDNASGLEAGVSNC